MGEPTILRIPPKNYGKSELLLCSVELLIGSSAFVDDLLNTGSQNGFHSVVPECIKVSGLRYDSLCKQGIALDLECGPLSFFRLNLADIEVYTNAGIDFLEKIGCLDVLGVNTGIAEGEGKCIQALVADIKTVDQDGVVNVVSGVHDLRSFCGFSFNGAVGLGNVSYAFISDLEELAYFGLADEVKIHHGSERLLVGRGEEYFAVNGSAQVFSVNTGVILEGIDSDIVRIGSDKFVQAGSGTIVAIAVGAVPVTDE